MTPISFDQCKNFHALRGLSFGQLLLLLLSFRVLSLSSFHCLFSSFADLDARCQIDCKTRLKCSVLVYYQTFNVMGLEFIPLFRLSRFIELCTLRAHFDRQFLFVQFFFLFLSLSDECLAHAAYSFNAKRWTVAATEKQMSV